MRARMAACSSGSSWVMASRWCMSLAARPAAHPKGDDGGVRNASRHVAQTGASP